MFECGSFSHLIRDCDFHEKRMAKQAELNNGMSKGSSQREIRPVWNNVQRMNHQNQFVPTTVQTRTGKIPVNTAKTSGTNTVNTVRHNFNSQAVQINADRKVNTVKPIVNNAKPKAGFHKSVSPFRKSFNRTTTLRTNFSKQKVNTAEDYPHRALQNKGIFDSGCSRHMTGNKPYLMNIKTLMVAAVLWRKEDQVFLDELERLKRQEKDANDAAEALRKEFAQDTEDLLLQAGATKASSTNIINTASTHQTLEDESWVDAMQEELLQFKIQKVWILVDLPYGKKAIGTKWVYRNKKDERGVVVRNKARLVAQGHRQEEGSMIGSLMYLTASRPGYFVCQSVHCSKGFRSLQRPLQLNSDYAGANLDRKSTTGEAEYVAAVNCLWASFMDSKSNNPVFHSKTKHIAIRHHFIRDAYEKKLIQVLKIHTDDNVADLLTRHLMLAGSSSGCILLGSDQPKAALANGLKNVPVPLDHFPINALTSKVFSFMVKKGKHFSGKVTPLFPNMLVQPTEDEGEGSERPSEPQPIPSPPHPSTDQHETQTNPSPRPSPTSHITDSIPEGSGGNHGGQSSSDRSLSGNEGGMTLQSVGGNPPKLNLQSSKEPKGAPTVPTNTEWDDLDMDIDDTMDYTLAQDEGKTDKVDEKGESTAQQQSTDRQDEGTDMPKVSTARTKLSTDKVEEGTAEPEPRESTSSAAQTTPTPTPTTFGDDETIAQVLLNMSQAKAVSKEKEKGVEIRNAENAERPRTTSTRSVLTLKPLPKIDPNDKGKKRIEEDEESDTESEEITEAKKKFDQIAHDEEVARKMQEEWEAEEERKRLTEEEATKTALSNEYDFIQARIEADRLLAERVQEAEREQFTVEERAKFLHDTIATQRRILAQQRSEAIRNKPPTKNQFRNQMMTYLKHVGNKKHADLKTKSFDEIKALYEKVKRFDDSFITIGSTEDERKIKEMNEGASDPDKKKKIVKEDVSAKVPAKQDVAEQGTKKRKGGHMKMIARKRKRPQPDVDSDDEHIKCLKIVTFEGTIDSEIMETKSFISNLDKVSSPEGDYLVVYRVNGNFRAFNYLMEVLELIYASCLRVGQFLALASPKANGFRVDYPRANGYRSEARCQKKPLSSDQICYSVF
ncbi:ribonuclease H-like domain-containing protein [Tanacetum coccineum]